jgi:thioredoxin 1
MATLDLTDHSFESTIDKQGIVLVDFWGPRCGPCRAFAPVFEKASDAHADIVFGKLNTDEHQQVAMEAGIRAVPTIMAFRDGILVYRGEGALPPAHLERLIEKVRELDMDVVKAEVEKRASEHQHGPNCDHDH